MKEANRMRYYGYYPMSKSRHTVNYKEAVFMPVYFVRLSLK